jgi:Na+/H+ antiporter NhaC
MWMDLTAIRGQTPSEPPTINPWPYLVFIALVFVAYMIVSYIKEILTFLLVLAIFLMLLGGFYVVQIIRTAFETSPSVTEIVEPRAPPPSSEVY